MSSPPQIQHSVFAQDVLRGLKAEQKSLPSRYFYDAAGSEIFRQIMRMDTYYLTDVEYEIFDTQQEDILQAFQAPGGPFRLVEFGAGDGLKTKILLRHFLAQQVNFSYVPIDISGAALAKLENGLKEEFPTLAVDSREDEYFAALRRLQAENGARKVVLFLGSNIGNFPHEGAVTFLKELASGLGPEDLVLIGFDLKKDPQIILDAYHDPEGITRKFNLNLLTRMNRELGADFDQEAFLHYPTYDPISGACKSHLLSNKDQTVHFSFLDESIHFKAWEPIWMELSQKYDTASIQALAEASGFKVVGNFTDEKQYFVNSLWELR
ncbi:MAG: L-histidine N(alpha)-methyltransferase [Bacteroidota bacterium]